MECAQVHPFYILFSRFSVNFDLLVIEDHEMLKYRSSRADQIAYDVAVIKWCSVAVTLLICFWTFIIFAQ